MKEKKSTTERKITVTHQHGYYDKYQIMFCRTSLSWFNYSLLLVNGLFHVIHLVQTHWTYDATAQDTMISSSQVKILQCKKVYLFQLNHYLNILEFL